jgi:hypothetical protein
MRSTPISRLALLVLAVLALGVGALAPSSALAICNPATCEGPGDPLPPPAPKPPVVTTIGSFSPSFGWKDDTVVISGTGFAGATVTFNGVAAPIVSGTGTQLVVNVPAIPMSSLSFGPTPVPVVVSSSKGTASATFTLSPALHAEGGTTFGLNSQFGQGADGSGVGTLDLDRWGGHATLWVRSIDTQWWSSLSVSMSAVLADKNGVVIGFTDPLTATANGVFYNLAGMSSTVTNTRTDALDATMTQNVHSAMVVVLRDGATELQSTLANAVLAGQTLASVLSALGIA